MLVTMWFADSAGAQEPNLGAHSGHLGISVQELAVGIAHGAAQGATVFLVGLVAFVVLVWLPISKVEDTNQQRVIELFCRWIWVLLCLLVVAGLVELPLYTVNASGEALSFSLLRETLFNTRVGDLCIERLAFGFLTAIAATYAGRLQRSVYWGVAVALSAALLATLTQQSHAAAENSFIPFAADWLHVVAASLWMGGLLGFAILLVGALRAMPIETRRELLGRTVRRFSKVATFAVMTIIATGLYAALLHVPNLSALFDTPYGHMLTIKLGLLIFLLALGAQNLRLGGKEPFGRLVGAELALAIGIFVATGLLTSLPPADVAQQQILEERVPNQPQDGHQPPLPSLPTSNAP